MLTVTATNLPRVMRCMGSHYMEPSIPVTSEDEQRREGTAAHWCAETMFHGTDVTVGTKAPNGHVVTDDMLEHVRTYLGALDAGHMEVDTTFQDDGWQVRGRADHIKYRTGMTTLGPPSLNNPTVSESVLTIDDFKYGWRAVSPVENWTLLAHAIGWCIRNGVRPDVVTLRIHQPRPFHSDGPLREWEVPEGYHGLVQRYNAITQLLSNPTDTLTAGLDQCAKCHARYDCPAFNALAYNALDAVVDTAFSDDVPNGTLARQHDTFHYAQQVIKTKCDALDELMTHRIETGQVIPGYALKQRHGQRRWATGLTGAMVTALTGTDCTKDGLVTPAEAERRGADVSKLVERPSIGVKLERVDVDAVGRAAFGGR